MITPQLEHEQKDIRTRRTVIDIAILQAIRIVLEENRGNTLTSATIFGISAQIKQTLCEDLKVNHIPQDLVDLVLSQQEEQTDGNESTE